MIFDYSKLLGRIKECGFTQNSLAEAIGINKSTLSAKLNNKNVFTTIEMVNILRLLDVPMHEIDEYFFVEKVQKK